MGQELLPFPGARQGRTWHPKTCAAEGEHRGSQNGPVLTWNKKNGRMTNSHYLPWFPIIISNSNSFYMGTIHGTKRIGTHCRQISNLWPGSLPFLMTRQAQSSKPALWLLCLEPVSHSLTMAALEPDAPKFSSSWPWVYIWDPNLYCSAIGTGWCGMVHGSHYHENRQIIEKAYWRKRIWPLQFLKVYQDPRVLSKRKWRYSMIWREEGEKLHTLY